MDKTIDDVVTLPWGLREYEQCLSKMQNGFNVKAEALMKENFPPPNTTCGFETWLFIVVNKASEIELWHLPSVISKRLQCTVEKATSELHQKAPTLFKIGNGPAT